MLTTIVITIDAIYINHNYYPFFEDFYKMTETSDIVIKKAADYEAVKLMCRQLSINAVNSIFISMNPDYLRAAQKDGFISLQFKPEYLNIFCSCHYLFESYSNIDISYLTAIYMHEHNIPVTIGTTERLTIRELSLGDFEFLFKIFNDSKAEIFDNAMSSVPSIEADKFESYIKNQYSFYGYGYWGILLKDENKLIGCCGIEDKSIEGKDYSTLGYILSPEFQGHGYAYEAAAFCINYVRGSFGIDKIYAEIDKNNMRSLRLIRRLEFSSCKTELKNNHILFCFPPVDD